MKGVGKGLYITESKIKMNYNWNNLNIIKILINCRLLICSCILAIYSIKMSILFMNSSLYSSYSTISQGWVIQTKIR